MASSFVGTGNGASKRAQRWAFVKAYTWFTSCGSPQEGLLTKRIATVLSVGHHTQRAYDVGLARQPC